jgi:hypothetical protein
LVLSAPDSQISIAGSVVMAARSAGKLPRLKRRWVSFCAIISRCELTRSLLVANQSCQIRVIRSTSGARLRTIRSSHHSTSSPQAS